jgi:hypothetical protein
MACFSICLSGKSQVYLTMELLALTDDECC